MTSGRLLSTAGSSTPPAGCRPSNPRTRQCWDGSFHPKNRLRSSDPLPDLDAGLAFYRDGLGLSLVWRAEDVVGLRMPGTDAEIVLRTQPGQAEIDLLVESADTAVESFREGWRHYCSWPI